MALNSPEHMFARAKDFGMTFQSETTDAGLALALGVAETRPIDLVTAYGTLANGGVRVERTTILKRRRTDGEADIEPSRRRPEPVQVVSPQAAYIVTDILQRQHDPRGSTRSGASSRSAGPDGERRPATLKTGTNNDAKDLNAYGYIAPPTEEGRAAGAYALAVGVWNGNSDNTPVSTPARPVFSIDVSTFVWQGFLQEASAKWEITRFARPAEGLTQVAIDPFTGLLPLERHGRRRRMVHRRHRAATIGLPEDVCGDRPRSRPSGHERKFAELARGRPRLAPPRRSAVPARRAGPDRTQDGVLLQQRLQPVRLGRGVRS